MIYETIGTYSQNGYHIPELAVSVHSFEELCHVVRENLYELGDYLMSDELIGFIREGFSLNDLADDMVEARPKLADYVRVMLSYRHYLGEDEVAKICGRLSGEGDVREYVRLVTRGDFLVENKKYRSAMLMYEHAREIMDKESDKDAGLYSSLMQKLGRLYALYFLFEKAAECYSVAGDERRTFFCRKLSMSRVEYVDMLLHERPDEELAALVEDMTRKPAEVAELEQSLKDSGSYGGRLAAERLASRLKAEYRRM